MQLQNAKKQFEEKGIGLAAVSYDTPAILRDFAERHKIDFPLLADPDSKIIARFGVLNTEATGMTRGMAHPGYFYADANGVVREKYFEAKYTDRFTANNVIGKIFPELAEEVSEKVEAPHLSLLLGQSDRDVIPGSRVSLEAQITLPPDVHVYAPGVAGYKPIQLALDVSPDAEFTPPDYPHAKTLYLAAIREKVAVFEGKFRISCDARINANPDFAKSLGATGKTVRITGRLNYQACDKTTCYVPTSVPVSWQLQVLPLDRQRSPAALQHK